MKKIPTFENFENSGSSIDTKILQELKEKGVLWNYPFKAWQYVKGANKKNFKTLEDLMSALGQARYSNGKIMNCKVLVVHRVDDPQITGGGTVTLTSDVTKELGPLLKKYFG